MSTVVEYTMRTKPEHYDSVLAEYVRIADQVGIENRTERLILVVGDRASSTVRGIGVFGSRAEADAVVRTNVFAELHAAVDGKLAEPPSRTEMDLVHVFIKP